MPNLWHCEMHFVSSDPSGRAYHCGLRPIIMTRPVARSTCKDWRDLVRRLQDPGDSDIHIYARQRPPEFSWKLVRSQKHIPGILHLDRVSTLTQYLPPPPPTSDRSGYEVLYRSPIDILNDDALLEIFNHLRLDDERGWDLQLQWSKLSHICRRWRSLIFGSSSYLKIHLPILKWTSIIPMVTQFPPLPLVIDCKAETRIGGISMFTMYELWLLFALEHRDRMRHIALQASPQDWHQLFVYMHGPFQRTEYLSLASTATEDTAKLTLPESFMAPNLRHLTLTGIGLSKGLPLLASTVALVTLKLCRIQHFSPEDLVTRLQRMPHLKELSIDFSTPFLRPNTGGELMQTPISVVSLPALKQLEFHGVAAYLDSLVSRINAPVLEQLTITLFNQASFTLPHLSQFMNTAEELRHPISSVLLDHEAVSIAISHHEPPFEDVFNLRVRCSQFNWQINSAAQICAALLPILSIVEELTLDSYGYVSHWHFMLQGADAVTSAVWRDLILPFKRVRKLSFSHVLWSGLSTALHLDGEGPGSFLRRLLPELQTLEIKPRIQHPSETLAQFTNLLPLERVVVPTSQLELEAIDWPDSLISLPDSDESSSSYVSSMRRNWLRRTIRVVNRVRNLKRLVPRILSGSLR